MKKILCVFSLCFCFHLMGNQIDSWTSPFTLSTTGVDSSNPSIAMDSSANTTALWLEGDVVTSKTLPFGSSWSSATALSGSGASAPQLMVDPAGNATAIWVESGLIKAATLPFGTSWGSATTLSASGSSAPQIAVDATGNIVAVWVTGGVVQSATLPFGGSWSSVSNLSGSNASSPQVSIGSNGTVVAVWHIQNGTTLINNVQSVTKTSIGGAWSTATDVSNPAMESVFPQVAVDSAGNAVCIWFTYTVSTLDGFFASLAGAALPSGGSWTTPTTISSLETRNPTELMAEVLFADNGSAIALWTDSEAVFGDAVYVLNSSQSDNLTSWSIPIQLNSDLYTYAGDVTLGDDGNAFGIFMGFDSVNNRIAISALESHVGQINTNFWTTPTILSGAVQNGYPKITGIFIGNSANAGAIWINFDGSNKLIQSSIGSGTLIAPPSNLVITQSSTDFGVFTEYFNTLTWDASTDPGVLDYAIFGNGTFLTFVSAATLSYVDHNQVQNGSITYEVRTLDSSGTVSLPLTASFP